MSSKGVKERESRYIAGCSEIGGPRNGLSALVSTGAPWAAEDSCTLVGTGVQLESVRKETGVEEVQTAGGHRIRSLVWRGSGRCCDVCRGSWDEAAGIFFFF